jgi:hypothetical protein
MREDDALRESFRYDHEVKRAAPYLLFAGVTLAVFWKFLLFGQTLYAMSAIEHQFGRTPEKPRGWFTGDIRHTGVSDNVVVLAGLLRRYNEGLKANELRLWNPSLFCGLPAYANPMLHPFYPPNLVLHRLFSPDAAYQIGLMLHFFFSGATMYLLLRGIGRTPIAAAAGGLVWMLGGYNAMWFSTAILAGATVFGPLALLAVVRGLETRDRSRAALGGAAMGMAILGSHPQHAVLFFLLVLAWIAAVAIRTRELRSFALRFGGLFVLFSIGVGLVDILTRLDTIENGYREPEFDRLSFYGNPWLLATHVAGLLLGKVYFPGPGFESEFATYAGLSAIALAVTGAVRRWNETGVRVAAIAGATAIAVAFFYPLAWLFMKIPILNLSPPSRCLFVAGFAIALLSAQGLDELATHLGRAPLATAAATLAFAAVLLAGRAPFRLLNGAAVETLIGFGLATGAAWLTHRSRPAAAALGFAAILFELLPLFLQLNPHADSSLLSRTPEPVRLMNEPPGPWRGTGVLATVARSTRTEEWGRDLVTGNNLLALYGVENIAGFEAIIPRSYFVVAEAAGARVSPAGRTLQFTKFDSPLLDFLGLKHVLLPPTIPMPARFRKIETFGPVALFENRAALPRARMVSDVRTAAGEPEAEELLRNPKFDPRREVIVECDRPLGAGEGEVTWKERTPDRTALEVVAKQNGVLVVADTDYPGWEATVDGTPAPILRANLAFRAVEIPAGTHLVDFRFRPSSARHGLLASMLFLLLSAGAAFYRRKV